MCNKNNLPVFIVAIDGRAGSGKTTLANFLAERLKAQIVHTDDFSDWSNPLDWWPSVVERVFEPIGNNEKVLSYVKTKWWPIDKSAPLVNQIVTPIMIIEGVGSLQRQLRPYVSYGIFIDIPSDVCLNRGLDRDKGQGGVTESKLRQMWLEWCVAEEQYIKRDNPRSFADLIVDEVKPLEDSTYWLKELEHISIIKNLRHDIAKNTVMLRD